jgi:hypothetical protein
MDTDGTARLVCVGQDASQLLRTRWLRIIRSYSDGPWQIAIGVEVLREPQQSTLNHWTRRELTELEFLKAIDLQRTG